MAAEMAKATVFEQQVLLLQAPEMQSAPPGSKYSDKDLDVAQQLGAKYDEQARVWRSQDKAVLPRKMARELVAYLHRWIHLGHKKLKTLLEREEQFFFIPRLDSLVRQITGSCIPCAKVITGLLKLPEGARIRGVRPGTNWEIDFTEIHPGSLQAQLRVLQLIQNQVWKLLAAVYQSKSPTVPYTFEIGDSVYVRRHQSKTLEPR
ncbi:hypothetical protein STEG23_031733 [Scotinomys teguina]